MDICSYAAAAASSSSSPLGGAAAREREVIRASRSAKRELRSPCCDPPQPGPPRSQSPRLSERPPLRHQPTASIHVNPIFVPPLFVGLVLLSFEIRSNFVAISATILCRSPRSLRAVFFQEKAFPHCQGHWTWPELCVVACDFTIWSISFASLPKSQEFLA